MYGVYEFVVLLESFKNIDLFRQGYYLVRAHLYTERITREGVKEKHKLALPYHILRESKENSAQIPADFDNSLNVFHSKTFRVQYCEEEILLQDACLFRFELNLNKPPVIFLELELMFSEYTALMANENAPIPTLDQFVSQCNRVFLLNDLLANSVHGMYPVLFDDAHYCQLNLLVHSMVIESKFRQKSASSHSSDTLTDEEKKVVQSPRAQNFQQMLFPTRAKPYTQKELARMADELHRYYVGCLLRPHLKLIKAFQETVSRCMSRRQKSELGFFENSVGPARFPGVLKSSETKPQEHKAEEDGDDEDAVGVEKIEEDLEEDLLATVGAVARARGYVKRRNSESVNPPSQSEDEDNRRNSDSSTHTSNTSSAASTPVSKRSSLSMSAATSVSSNAIKSSSSSSSSSNTLPSSASACCFSSSSSSSLASPSNTTTIHYAEPKPRLSIPSLNELPLESLATRLKGALTVEGITKAIQADMQAIAPQNFELWNRFIQTLPSVCENLVKLYSRRAMKLSTQQTGAFVFRESYGVADRWKVAPLDLEAKHRSLVEIARGTNHLSGLPVPFIQQTQGSDLFDPPTQPVFFEEAYDWEQLQTPLMESEIKVLDHHFDGVAAADGEINLDVLADAVDDVCEWACLACTFINHGSLPQCELCSSPRDGAESIKTPLGKTPNRTPNRTPTNKTSSSSTTSSSSQIVESESAAEAAETKGHKTPIHDITVPPPLPSNSSMLSVSSLFSDHAPIIASIYPPSPDDLTVTTAAATTTTTTASSSTTETTAATTTTTATSAATTTTSSAAAASTAASTTAVTTSTTTTTTTTTTKNTKNTTTSTTAATNAKRNSLNTSTALVTSVTPSHPSVRIVLPPSPSGPRDLLSDMSGPTGIIPNYPYHTPAAYKARLKPKRKRPYQGKHVFVLVHGYQGNVWDMRLFKNRLLFMFPNALCLLSSSNEGKTEGAIDEMGRRLATEVDDFIRDNCRNGAGLGRLSFVCHSLGGIIMRAALAQALEEPEAPSEETPSPAIPKRGVLKPYLDKLYTFISLASAHCGYIYSENPLLTTGIWVLKRWNKSVSLSQLSLSDNQDPTECFLYKLSQKKGLEFFENILLLASMQDKYVPFHSARIELHAEAMNESKKGLLYRNMVHNLLGPLKSNTLKRFNIVFANKANNFDSFIGRTAHIYFLDQVQYIAMLCSVYKNYLV